MAQFRGTVQGQRGEVSRLGSKSSGLTVEGNGWGIGARIELSHNEAGEDVVQVYRTGGSNARAHEQLICEFTEDRIDFDGPRAQFFAEWAPKFQAADGEIRDQRDFVEAFAALLTEEAQA